MGKSLKEYIDEIRSITIDNSLSDDAVIALMNIHLSIMTMIVADMLEDEYGSVEFHREAIEKLFIICRKRSASNQTLVRCSRMTPAMYNVFCMPDSVFDYRKHNSCLNRSFRIADEWYEKTRDSRPFDEIARITEYGVLQSILDTFIYVVGEDKETERDYLYLRRRIGEWFSEFNDSGCWCGISDYEAIRRINLMIGHSNTNRDKRFDAQIEKALCVYFTRITGNDHIDCQTLFYLYWALMWGVKSPDNAKIDIITDYAVRMVKSPFAVDRDKRLWYLSVLIDRECVMINSEIKRKMRAYSA